MRAYNKSLIAVRISNSRTIVKARARFASASTVLAAVCASALAQENVSAWWLKKGQMLMRDHDYVGAKEAFDRATGQNPQDVWAWKAKGEVLSRLAMDLRGLAQEKLYEDYIYAFDRALELDSSIAEIWAYKGHLLQSRAVLTNDRAWYCESIKCYDAALALDAQMSEARDGNAMASAAPEERDGSADSRSRGRVPEAVDEAIDEANEKAIGSTRSDRELSQAWACKADDLLSLGKYKEAFEAYDKAISLDPQDAGYLRIQAFLADHLGRHDQSLCNYGRVLQMNPEDPCAWLGEADALFKMGRYQESLEAFEEALKIEPGMIQAWIGKGDALSKLERLNEACSAYKKSLSLNDKAIHKSSGNCSAWAWIARGDALKGLDRCEEAIRAYDSAIEVDPERFQAWCSKGDVLMSLCRYDQAAAAYDKAIEKDPSIPRIWAKKGIALKTLGRTSEAKEAYARAEGMGYLRI